MYVILHIDKKSQCLKAQEGKNKEGENENLPEANRRRKTAK
jgi:hypothetical protein